jgi:hypothetical protein
MARQKKKTCLYCYAPLCGRRDAKTCSPRCRKRLQRARLLLERDLVLAAGIHSPSLSYQPDANDAQTKGALS